MPGKKKKRPPPKAAVDLDLGSLHPRSHCLALAWGGVWRQYHEPCHFLVATNERLALYAGSCTQCGPAKMTKTLYGPATPLNASLHRARSGGLTPIDEADRNASWETRRGVDQRCPVQRFWPFCPAKLGQMIIHEQRVQVWS